MPTPLVPATASPTSTCSACKRTQKALHTPLKKCGKCKSKLYCSEHCSIAVWPGHKTECQAIRAGATAPSRPASTTSIPTHLPGQGGGPQMLVDVLEGMGVGADSTMVRAVDEAAPPPTASEPGLVALTRGAAPNAYLSRLSEAEAVNHLIDCFRLRCADEMKFNNNPVGLYKREDPMLEFRAFLNMAEDNNVLPVWWSAQRR